MSPAGPIPLRIQTDTFCEGCGYNLFSQKVWIDERLGIPVTRCPECARHRAAGHSDPALAHRSLAFVTGIRVLVTVASVGLDLGLLGSTLFMWLMTHTNQALYAPYWRYMVVAWPTPQPDPVTLEILLGWALIQGWSFGATFVISMWHWKRRWHKLMALAPYSVALVTWLGWYPPNVRDAIALAASMVFFVSFAVFGAWLAVYTARPIARATVRAVLAPRLRGPLVFLWHVDGKKPPEMNDPFTPNKPATEPSAPNIARASTPYVHSWNGCSVTFQFASGSLPRSKS